MKVRSGRGDKGFTDLYSRRMVSKDTAYITALGDLDELNSFLGLARFKIRPRKDKELLKHLQQDILLISAEIAGGEKRKKKTVPVSVKGPSAWIKKTILTLEEKVSLDNTFCLPGDNEISSLLDIARSIARRAERSVVRLFREDKIRNEDILAYVNCISDLLFIMARRHGIQEGNNV